MAVALSTLKVISPMVMISIDMIQGRQRIFYASGTYYMIAQEVLQPQGILKST